MKSCEQTKGQSVYEHGVSVKNYLFDLLDHLRKGTPLKYKWCLPDWLYENKDMILKSLPNDWTLKLYTEFHDCGKPYCLTIDENGKRHFPNHAKVSYEVFNQIFDNKISSDLILHDMDIHLLKSEGVPEFCNQPYCLTSLIVGLSEVHSNSNMFGGMDSEGFIIKSKRINKRGKQIINYLNNNLVVSK